MQTTNSSCIDAPVHVQFSDLDFEFPGDQNPEIDQNGHVPLLLQPTYARSKSLLFDELHKFRISLKWGALDHSSCVGKFVSYFVFSLFAILIPIVSSLSIDLPSSSGTEEFQYINSFNKLVQFPESGLALVAFVTLSCFFRKYGLRQLLFLDGLHDDTPFVRRGYSQQLEKAFRYLACILIPSFIIELAHKIIFFSKVNVVLPYIGNCDGVLTKAIMVVFVLASWAYRTGVFLLVCVLFRLTCELQILRFEGFRNLFDGCETDPGVIFREHIRIKKQLYITSHRYRFFIIACLFTITVSQVGALLLILAFETDTSFFNSGDIVMCSVVQLCGFVLCVLGAARITHRSQRIVSVATKWHMIATSASARLAEDTLDINENPAPKSEDEDESDSSDIYISVSPQDPASFQTRQAFVSYLQHNNGGITLYGFTLDRGLLHTIFAFEFSLVLWILSKVVVLSND